MVILLPHVYWDYKPPHIGCGVNHHSQVKAPFKPKNFKENKIQLCLNIIHINMPFNCTILITFQYQNNAFDLCIQLTLESWNPNTTKYKSVTDYIMCLKRWRHSCWLQASKPGWDGHYAYFARVPLCRLWNLLTISIPFIVSFILSLTTWTTLFPYFCSTAIQATPHQVTLPGSRKWPTAQAREQSCKPRVSFYTVALRGLEAESGYLSVRSCDRYLHPYILLSCFCDHNLS